MFKVGIVVEGVYDEQVKAHPDSIKSEGQLHTGNGC